MSKFAVVAIVLVFFSNLRLSVGASDVYDEVTHLMPDPRPSLNYTTVQRIINGFEAKPNAFPYFVGIEILVSGGWTWCGGAIISQDWVLTAAHCVDSAIYINVLFGAHDRLNNNEAGRIKMNVLKTNFIIHSNWNYQSLTNDIALVKLPTKIQYSKTIQPIALPTRAYVNNDFEGSPTVVGGWGYLKGTSSLSRYLQFVDALILNVNTCHGYLRQVTSTHICIDGSYGRGACFGDSGSPMVSTTGHRVLMGVTSFVSAAGCEVNYPSVYTRVTSFLDWISTNTGIYIP